MTDNFDLESVLEAEIAPLMEQIFAICQRERMPMLAIYHYGQVGTANNSCIWHLDSDDSRESPRITLASRVLLEDHHPISAFVGHGEAES